MNETQKKTLLDNARNALLEKLSGIGTDPGRTDDPVLEQKRGVFVSVYVNKELRGCTGYLSPAFGLIDAVRSCAVSAATEDSRFDTVVAAELDTVSFEISVLDPPHGIEDPLSVETGRHGVIVKDGPREGLLLPQVAVRHGLTSEGFLEAACRKADLPPDHWKKDQTRVEVFTAEVFADPAVK